MTPATRPKRSRPGPDRLEPGEEGRGHSPKLVVTVSFELRTRLLNATEDENGYATYVRMALDERLRRDGF